MKRKKINVLYSNYTGIKKNFTVTLGLQILIPYRTKKIKISERLKIDMETVFYKTQTNIIYKLSFTFLNNKVTKFLNLDHSIGSCYIGTVPFIIKWYGLVFEIRITNNYNYESFFLLLYQMSCFLQIFGQNIKNQQNLKQERTGMDNKNCFRC